MQQEERAESRAESRANRRNERRVERSETGAVSVCAHLSALFFVPCLLCLRLQCDGECGGGEHDARVGASVHVHGGNVHLRWSGIKVMEREKGRDGTELKRGTRTTLGMSLKLAAPLLLFVRRLLSFCQV